MWVINAALQLNDPFIFPRAARCNVTLSFEFVSRVLEIKCLCLFDLSVCDTTIDECILSDKSLNYVRKSNDPSRPSTVSWGRHTSVGPN